MDELNIIKVYNEEIDSVISHFPMFIFKLFQFIFHNNLKAIYPYSLIPIALYNPSGSSVSAMLNCEETNSLS